MISWRIKEWVNHESETCSISSKLDLCIFVLFSRSFSLVPAGPWPADWAAFDTRRDVPHAWTGHWDFLVSAQSIRLCQRVPLNVSINRIKGFRSFGGNTDDFKQLAHQQIVPLFFLLKFHHSQFLTFGHSISEFHGAGVSSISQPTKSSALRFDPWRQPGTHTFRSGSVDGWLILWYFNILTYIYIHYILHIVRKHVIWNFEKMHAIPSYYSHFPSYSLMFHYFPVFQDLVDLACEVRTCIPLFWRMWRQVETSSESAMNMVNSTHDIRWSIVISLQLRPVIRLMDSWNRRLPKSMQARISWRSHFEDTRTKVRASKPDQHRLLFGWEFMYLLVSVPFKTIQYNWA